MAFQKCHQPTSCHVYRISRDLIDKILLHLGDIYDTCQAQLLELGVINVCPVQGDDVSACVICRLGMKLSFVAADVNLISEGTPSFVWILVWTFMPPSFPVLGWRPTPLKIRLENRLIVVESIICSRQVRRPAAQSKLRSSAQGLLRLLCATDTLNMQINRDFTLSQF